MQVIHFLYGRVLNPSERALASQKSFWRKGAPALSRAGSNWMLSAPQRERLESFYRKHVIKGLGGMLLDLMKQGIWVVGFDGQPWTQYQSFNMTLTDL